MDFQILISLIIKYNKILTIKLTYWFIFMIGTLGLFADSDIDFNDTIALFKDE